MALNSRVRPLSHSSRRRPVEFISRMMPLPYSGDANLVIDHDDGNVHKLLWLTHLDNSFVDATIATTSEEDIYPSTNLQALPMSAAWRSTSAVVQHITVDLGEAANIDLLALVNHNLTSSATITISAGSTTAYSDFSATMTRRPYIAFRYLTTPQFYRYWRITISDTGNADGYVEVGYAMVGLCTKPQFTFRQGWVSTPEFVSARVESEFGAAYVEELYRRQQLNLSFGPLLESWYNTLLDLHDTVRGNVYPLLIVPDKAVNDAYFGRLQPLFTDSEEFRHYVELAIIEDSYGASLSA